MKLRIKGIAFLLFVVMSLSCLLTSSASGLHNETVPTEPVLQNPIPTAPTVSQPTVPSTETIVPPTTSETIPVTTTPPTTVPPATESVTTPPDLPTTQTTVPPTVPPVEPLTASHAFLYTLSTDSYLFLKGSMEDRIYPASITKLFAAYVALLHLDPHREITVGSAIYTVPPDSSLAFLSIGDVLTVEDLIHGMLLPSGGDAARVIAAETGRFISGKSDISDLDAINVFVEEMNRQATALGMTGTHFVTPDGFHDSNHYTTMGDLLLLAKLSLETPLIRQVAATKEYPVTLSGRSTSWRNTNMLLHEASQHPEFYRETAIGLKTGFTGAAGRCLLAAFLVDGETILSGVFGCPDPNWGFIAQFEYICYLYDTYLAP